MNRWMHIGLLLAASVCCSGCTEFQERMISLRNQSWAVSAYNQVKRDYPKMPHHLQKHFARGWRDGYYSVAQSGSGRVPMLPPRRYWGVHFQNPMGHDEIKAWFEGFQEGATAAEADGVDFWRKIPTSGMGSKTYIVGGGNIEQVPPGNPLQQPLPDVEELPPSRSTTSWPEGAPRLP